VPPEAVAPEPPGAAAQDAPEATIDAVEEVLDQVDAALARLDDGTYGRCTRCGDPLDDGRLAGDPTALLCGGCASTPTG
jgi:RNA polymerase-binding transcription factor DksA